MPAASAWQIILDKPIQAPNGKWIIDHHGTYDSAFRYYDSEEEAWEGIRKREKEAAWFGIIALIAIVFAITWFLIGRHLY